MVTLIFSSLLKPSPSPVKVPLTLSVAGSSATPAFSSASLTAAMMPLEVQVAPAVTSTSALLFSTMAAGICSSAGSAMPSDSAWLSTFTSVILPLSRVMVTLIFSSLLKPSPSPEKLPLAANAEAAPSISARHNRSERVFLNIHFPPCKIYRTTPFSIRIFAYVFKRSTPALQPRPTKKEGAALFVQNRDERGKRPYSSCISLSGIS